MYQGSNLVPQSRSQNFLRFIAAHSLWAHNRSHSISVINSSRNVRWLRARADCITPFIRASVLPSVGCRCRQPIALATRQSLLRVRHLEGVICCPVSRTHAFISRRSSIQRRILQLCSRLDCGRARVAAQRHFVIVVQFVHRKLGTLRSGPKLMIMRYRIGL